jgi:DNA-directed RNA polymerase specialized sigma24 family protein
MNRIVSPAAKPAGTFAARSSRSLMVAVVLGTALTMGGDATAATKSPDQAITAISKYCTACWRNARLPEDRWGDCTQEVLTRLLQSVDREKWGSILAEETTERKEFLRAIDAVKKRTQRARKYAALTPDHADWRNTDDLRDRREALNLATKTVLSDRQKQIVELSATGWAIPDIAAKLGTTVDRVSDEKYKAIRKLRTHFGVE